MKVKDLAQFAVELKGEGLNRDEGVLYGSPEGRVKGVLVTWMATVEALQAAAARGCNTVLCHETLYFRPQGKDFRPQHLGWTANRNRLNAAAAGDLNVLRLHGTLDRICIWDDFVAALGIPDPTPGTGLRKVLTIKPTTVRSLVRKVKAVFKLKRVRVAGDLNKTVRTVGFPWGGLGLDSNIGYQAMCIERGADVLIAGECDECGMIFALDAGVPIIETGHSISENIGLRNFTKRLRKQFPKVPFIFYPKKRWFGFV